VVVFIIAFFLGERFEILLAQTLVLVDGKPMHLLNYPIALALFALAILSAVVLERRRAAARASLRALSD